MGFPLVPVLINLFMGHHEKLWLENWQGSEVLFYRSYVEDTFCLFHSENDALLFFNYINSRHPNTRFTKEKEIDHKIPFLDVLINNDTIFLSQVFTVRNPSRAFWPIILALYLILINWVSFALLLIEPTRSTVHGWVSTKVSRNLLKSLKRIFLQSI